MRWWLGIVPTCQRHSMQLRQQAVSCSCSGPPVQICAAIIEAEPVPAQPFAGPHCACYPTHLAQNAKWMGHGHVPVQRTPPSVTRVPALFVLIQQFGQPRDNVGPLRPQVVELMRIVGQIVELTLHAIRSRLHFYRRRESSAAQAQLQLPVALADREHARRSTAR